MHCTRITYYLKVTIINGYQIYRFCFILHLTGIKFDVFMNNSINNQSVLLLL